MAGAAEHLVCHDVHAVLSILLKAEPHMSQPDLNHAGKAKNAQAAKHIIQMLHQASVLILLRHASWKIAVSKLMMRRTAAGRRLTKVSFNAFQERSLCVQRTRQLCSTPCRAL
jgi:hypothetical protein